MRPIQSKVLAQAILAPTVLALTTLSLPAQTTTPPPGNVPATSQTSAPGESNPQTASAPTRREKKEAKKEKKQEKAAKKSRRQEQKEKKEAKQRADQSLPPA